MSDFSNFFADSPANKNTYAEGKGKLPKPKKGKGVKQMVKTTIKKMPPNRYA